MPSLPLFQVDAFTDRAFAGNPAAVCLLEREREDDWLQAVAVEMNLSETAFLLPLDVGFQLRWFTPAFEVDLCGHATLASAHVLWSEEIAQRDRPLRFQTRSGELTANWHDGLIELDFPATPAAPCEPPAELLAALDVQPAFVGKSVFDQFVVVDSEQTVRNLQPNFLRLGRLDMRGVIVTARSSDARYDFVSRYFAPAAGIDEDPVTGSAHCCLGPYWSQELGKSQLTAFQASRRGGTVHVRCQQQRVILGGQAVGVFRGQLLC